MLPYTYAPGLCSPTHPLSGQIPLSIRFRGYACGPGPLASITPVGNVGACGGTLPIYFSTLDFSGPPVLGQPLFVSVVGPPNETAYLFWSSGTDPYGIAVAAGSVCRFYLDIPSLLMLAAAGGEPIASGFLSPATGPGRPQNKVCGGLSPGTAKLQGSGLRRGSGRR